MKRKHRRHEHYLREHKDEADISRLSKKLAPPEERDAKSVQSGVSPDNDGTMVVDTGPLKMPLGFDENEQPRNAILGVEPVIVVILVLMIAFIAIIAYLIYLTPAPVK